MLIKVQLVNSTIDQALSDGPLDALDSGKQVKVLDYGELLKNGVMLGAVADALSGEAKPSLHVPAANGYPTSSRHGIISQRLKSRSLSCTIDSKKGKALARFQSEAHIVHSCEVAAETCLVDFLEASHTHRHIAGLGSRNPVLLLLDILILPLDLRVVGWGLSESILKLARLRPEAKLEDTVEGTRPAIAIDERLKEDDCSDTDTCMSHQRQQVALKIVLRPRV